MELDTLSRAFQLLLFLVLLSSLQLSQDIEVRLITGSGDRAGGNCRGYSTLALLQMSTINKSAISAWFRKVWKAVHHLLSGQVGKSEILKSGCINNVKRRTVCPSVLVR